MKAILLNRMHALKTAIVGNREQVDTERYFLTVTFFTAAIFLFILCIVHLIMNLSPRPVLIAGASCIVLAVLYFFVRFRQCLFYPKLAVTIWGLVMLDLTWYSKYLSNGPVLFFILIFAALVIWVWEGRPLILLLSVYFLNLILLFIIDYTAPAQLFEYPDDRSRSVDIFLSFSLYSFLLIFLLYVVKREFIRLKDRAIRSDRLKSAFLANMSHEIRTPMNSIVGFSQLLSRGENPAENENYSRIIQHSSENLARLINDIIDLSKIEAGDLEIKYSDFNLHDVFRELREMYRIELARLEKQSITVDYHLPDEPFFIHSDSLRIKQVMVNLLSNAAKFTRKGEIRFSCTPGGGELVFAVRDTGVGIPAEDQQKVFDRFIHFNYEGMNEQGSGIGLSIVERIVTLLGGQVWLESETGSGSVFYFSIPRLTVGNAILTDKRIRRSGNTDQPHAGQSILVVEDNELSSKVLHVILENMNIKYHHVRDGKSAIQFVEQHPDLFMVLMDLKIPEMDGYEATRIIKQINPDLPIIAQTAFAMSGDREKALQAGCDEYIAKPIDVEKLREIIRCYCT